MYVQRNIEAPSCNYSCSGKTIIVTHSVCVFVALGIQYAMHMRHIVICALSDSVVVLHISHKRHDFRKKSYWT
jgi:hypothetical protein